MEIPAGAARRLLEQSRVGRLATLDARGRPSLVPIVYVVIADELWSPIDGKPKRGGELARVRNIRRDPRVGVLIDQWSEDWQQLWWLRIHGEARVESTASGAAALTALAVKYPQYRGVPQSDGSDQLLVVRIRSQASWCASEAACSVGERSPGGPLR